MKMVQMESVEFVTQIVSLKDNSFKLQGLKEHISIQHYMDLEEWSVQMVPIILVSGGSSRADSVNGRSGIT